MKFRALAILSLVLSACSTDQPKTMAELDTLLLKGDVVTPQGIVSNGWIQVSQGRIVSISPSRPQVPAARVLETGDLVFPGFVDLHNHPMYNMLPRWSPGRTYDNRYKWRSGEPAYDAAIKNPQGAIVADYFCDIDAYVEVKALAGGTTSIIGTSKPSKLPAMPDCIRGLARNLDWYSGFHGTTIGAEPVRNAIGITPVDMKPDQLKAYRDELEAGKIRLLVIHIAEGKRSDPESQAEFNQLADAGLLGDRTAIVHGVALGVQDFKRMSAAGTALVWSPRSNFELYGETADIAGALGQNVSVAIAPDWSPSGSTNMLAEINYAWSKFGKQIPAKRLFDMATSVPARIAGIDDEVGSIAPGLRADLFVLKRSGTGDAYEALASAQPQDITLTLVNGVPLYGSDGNLAALGVARREAIELCGTPRSLARDALAGGSFADITRRLADALLNQNSRLGALAECGAPLR